MAFAVRLRELRETKGLLQRELAELVGMSQSTVARWEAGDREPTLQTLPQLADVLGTSIDDLVRTTETALPN